VSFLNVSSFQPTKPGGGFLVTSRFLCFFPPELAFARSRLFSITCSGA
jgi:hypothetical protein